MPKEIKPIQKIRNPEFIGKVRGGGKVDVITIPKDFINDFKIERGKTYRIRFIEEVSL
jgi:hypothetical protein